MLGAILSILLSGFVIGGLARWAVPGPDPMPIWLTVAIGVVGSLIGGTAALVALGTSTLHSGGDYFAVLLGEILASTLLVIAYRRFVQKRPITGPEALRPPTRGFGLRSRVPAARGFGLSPRVPSARTKQDALKQIDDLHEQGVLTDEEYVARRREILRLG